MMTKNKATYRLWMMLTLSAALLVSCLAACHREDADPLDTSVTAHSEGEEITLSSPSADTPWSENGANDQTLWETASETALESVCAPESEQEVSWVTQAGTEPLTEAETALKAETQGELETEPIIEALTLTPPVLPVPAETGEVETVVLVLPEIPSDTSSADTLTADDLDPLGDYQSLVITSVYTTGRGAGKGLAEASFVELYNGSDKDISLGGAALYLSGNEGAYAAYPFEKDHVIPAGGYFLIRGLDAVGTYKTVFCLDSYDAQMPFRPGEYGMRMAIAPVGLTLDGSLPMAELEGVFAYVTSADRDVSDLLHHTGKPDPDRLIRKKAATDQVDYQRIKLTEASYTVLEQIRPKTSEGDVNRAVDSLMAEVVFSVSGGVYENSFSLTLTAPEGYTVYYTLNGNDPRVARLTPYTQPISITNSEEMAWGQLIKACGVYGGDRYYPSAQLFPGAWVVRAYAVNDSDGSVTPMTTQTYFVGEIFTSSTLDLVSVSLVNENFLGYEGIYSTVTGGEAESRAHVPAYVELFTSKPQESATAGKVYAGWSEIAMNGKGSLGMTQKSFRILLKNEVEGAADVGENLATMDYDIFGEYASTTPDGQRVTWYKHILLRNGGGDMSGSPISRSHIGDAYIQRLDRFLGCDVMASKSVMVFVNGEFWGIYNARDRLDTKYFEGKYGIPEESFTMLECPHPLVFGWNADYVTNYGDPAEADEFMALIAFVRNNDLSVQANYDYVAERVDMDGLIDFFCAQIYLCCSDWPANNIKVWRNTDSSIMDTKWHFCIVDTDHGVGLNSDIHTNLFGVINDGSIMGSLFNRLCGNEAFRARFIQKFIWCTEVYYEPTWMLSELSVMVEDMQPYMQYQLDRWRVTDGSVTTYEKWYDYIEVIENFAKTRPEAAKAQLMAWSGLSESRYQTYLSGAKQIWGENPH